MKKEYRIFPLMIVLIFAVLFVFSCTGKKDEVIETNEEAENYSAKQIADAVMAKFDASVFPDMKKYLMGEAEGSESYLEPEYAGVLVSGNYATVGEFEYLSDYAMYTPLGHRVFEVDVLKVADKENIPKITDLLKARQAQKANGDIKQYNPAEEPMLTNSRVITAGSFVILLATTDNDKAQDAVSEIFKGSVEVGEEATTEPPTEVATTAPDTTEGTTVDNSIMQVQPEVIFDFNQIMEVKKSGLPADQQTPMPRVKVSQYSHDTMYILAGTCQQDGVITVTGGTEEIVSSSDFGDWLVAIPIKADGASVLHLTVQVPGKSPSDEIQFVVKPQKGITLFEDFGIYGDIVGLDYRNFFFDNIPDYEGTNILTDAEYKRVETKMASKFAELREKGLDKTEIIYLIITNPSKLYWELMPKTYTRYTGEVTLTTQFTKAATAAGAVVIDLENVLTAHKDDYFKIFHKTDSHWTDYGSMFGYQELMKYIAKRFPDAAPRPESDFEFRYERMYFGDIYYSLGLDRHALNETTVVSEFKFETPTGHRQLWDNDNVFLDHNIVGYEHESQTNLTGNFPRAYVMRDSFCGPLYTFLTDRFSNAFWRQMWNYNFNINDIAKYKPDYIIYVLTERNIRNFMYE